MPQQNLCRNNWHVIPWPADRMTHKVVPCSLPSVLYIPENVWGLFIIFPSSEKVQVSHWFLRTYSPLWISANSVFFPVGSTIGEALWVLRDAEGITLWLFHMTLMLTSPQIFLFFFTFPSQNNYLVDSQSMSSPLQYLAPFLQNFWQASGSPILKVWINYCYFRTASVLSLIELQLIYYRFLLTSPMYKDCNANPFQQSVCGSS